MTLVYVYREAWHYPADQILMDDNNELQLVEHLWFHLWLKPFNTVLVWNLMKMCLILSGVWRWWTTSPQQSPFNVEWGSAEKWPENDMTANKNINLPLNDDNKYDDDDGDDHDQTRA